MTILISLPVFSNLEKELKEMKLPNNRVIRITGHPDYPPVIWKKKGTSKLIGIGVEIIERAFLEINVKVDSINVDTWGRAQVEVAEGRIDMLLPPYKNEKRLKVYQYFDKPFLMDDTVIFVKKGKKFKYNSFEDLVDKTGVAIIHDSFGSVFDKFSEKKLLFQRLPKTEHCFNFLIKGRARYMVAGYNAGFSVAAKMGILDEIEILPTRVIVTGMYLPISFKSSWNISKIHKYLNQKVAQYHKEGFVKQLEKKYLKKFKAEFEKKIPFR